MNTSTQYMTRTYVHPAPVRLWHVVNALGFVLLIITGVQIRYSDLFSMMSFENAVSMHNWVGALVIANNFIWLVFYLVTDKISVYHAELNVRKHFMDSFRQMRFYGYGIMRDEPNPHKIDPHNKFNPLQKSTYQIIMLMLVPVQAFTGILLWDVKLFSGMIETVGGLRVVDTVHVLLFIAFVGFLLVHIYLGSLGHTHLAHFKAMVTGYEEEEHHDDAEKDSSD